MAINFKRILEKLAQFENLTKEEMEETLKAIVENQATPSQIGAFIMGMRMKGETIQELTVASKLFRELSRKVNYPEPEELLDTCGTGGDKIKTFNVSTMTALVCASAGVKIAKHGNRAVSSKCGSADFLEALGANIEIPPEKAIKLLEETNFVFLYAPLYHPAMKNVAQVRKELGIKSFFNLIGPLSNPAGAKRQLIGVYSYDLVEKVANVLKNLGVERAFVVHGMEGLDEVSITTSTLVAEIKEGEVKIYQISPEEIGGVRRRKIKDIRGGDCKRNIEIFFEVLEGKNEPAEDFIAINSAFALVAGGKVDTLREGVELAKETIRSGKVQETVEKYVKLSKEI
jgi:anthranilate phosphoribosyltransferase